MNRFAKSAIAAVAGFAAVVTPLAQAGAQEWRDGWYDEPVIVRHHRPRHHRNNDALVGGLIGLTAGLIIMDAVKSRPQPVYRPAPQLYDYPPAPSVRVRKVVRHVDSLEPWSDEWYRFCSQRYRSFNPETGTFRGHDGRNHFCTAN